MSKAVGTVVGIVVVAGIAWTGTAYYTGTQVEKKISESLDKANAQLVKVVPQAGVAFKLASFERGVFSSTARYSLTIAPPSAEGETTVAPKEIIVADKIEHGPFPWTRLKTGKLGPVMATSNAQLEKNDVVAKWFAATNDVAPVSSVLSLGYGGTTTGVVHFEPANYVENEHKLTFSGMDLDLDVARDGDAAKVKGMMDTLAIASVSKTDDKPILIEVKGAALDSDMTKGPADLYIGKNTMTIKTVTVSDNTPNTGVVLRDYAQRIDVAAPDGKLTGSLVYELGGLNYKGKELGSGQLAIKAGNLDPVALKTMSDLYSRLGMRSLRENGLAMGDEPLDVTPEESQAFQAALGTLLASNPTFAIDPLLIKTQKGESTFNLHLDLAKPSDKITSMDQVILETIKKLDAKLVVSKGMLAEVLTLAATKEGADPAQALQMATMQAELVSGMAAQSGVVTIDGDKIVSTLNYAAGQVDFNGKKMPVEEFAGQVFSMVLGSGSNMGMSGGMDDEEDEFEDEAEDEAAPADATPVKP